MSGVPSGAVLCPPPSAAARDLFGGRLAAACAYADLLASAGVERGLIGPREVPRLWERHLVNSAALAGEPTTGDRVADVGSGAGLPGLVVAMLRPDLGLTLIEPLLRRAAFLTEAVTVLGLGNVSVLRARAEDCTDLRGSFDVVLARAVAPLDRLAGWTLPLLRPCGRLLALKGASAADELAAAQPVLTGLGAESARLRTLGPPDQPATVIEVVAGRSHRRPPRQPD